jgi:asparagine synthase (glutamine-hydrolysing)
MCGIAGYSGFAGSKRMLEDMVSLIDHRGPDDAGFYYANTVGLGMRRLSIVDVANGAQPIFNEDRTLAIVLNGEIYNYRELKEGLIERGHVFSSDADTEVVIHLFEELGIECVHKLRGMFAFAIHDSRNDALYLVRDRLGIKPLYYFEENEKIIFGSEIKSIIGSKQISKSVNYEAVSKFLKFRYVPGVETLYDKILKLPAGHWMLCKSDSNTIEKYWDPAHYVESKGSITKPQISDEEYLSRFSRLFEEAVNLHLSGEGEIGSYLSGGLDSSLITTAASGLIDSPVRTYSASFGSDHDEAILAGSLAKSLGAIQENVVCTSSDMKFLPELIWYNDEPLGDTIALPTFLLSRAARKKVKVVLTGEGADELMGGYLFHKVLNYSYQLSRFIPSIFFTSIFAPIIKYLPVRWLNKIFDYPAYLGDMGREKVAEFVGLIPQQNVRKMYEQLISLFSDAQLNRLVLGTGKLACSTKTQTPTQQDDYAEEGISWFDRMILLQFSSWLPDNILMRQDRFSMANGVEARVPFLDHVLVEFLLGMPKRLKINMLTGENKILARKYGKLLLPSEVANRRKKAFYIPVEDYLNDPAYKAMVQKTLSDEQVIKRGWFDPREIKNLLLRAENGKEFLAAKQVFSLVALEIWCQMNIEDKLWK